MKKRDREIMIAAIYEVITSLFKDEENGGNSDYHYELDEIDLTGFFTNTVIALNLFYQEVTEQEATHVEFTHLLNSLTIQFLMENEEESEVE